VLTHLGPPSCRRQAFASYARSQVFRAPTSPPAVRPPRFTTKSHQTLGQGPPDLHDGLARRLVEEFHGQLVKTTGDGILATFDGPGRGIRCAAALREELSGIGLQLRAGLHTGEVELRDSDVGGIAVHIAARVMGTARPDEILTSRTVRDLVIGANIALEERGAHALKGIDGTWQLYAITVP
jgi:class 3 adenylate cyclase